MRNDCATPSLFARLRRDRGLFAVVACLTLAFAFLQPVLASAADGVSVRGTLCTQSGVSAFPGGDDSRTGPGRDGCPLCQAGHACAGMASSSKALVWSAVAFEAPALAFSRPRLGLRLSAAIARDCGRPPAIRAPPAFLRDATADRARPR